MATTSSWNSSTENLLSTESQTYLQYTIGQGIIKWTALILVLVGTIGNTLSFIVMSRKRMTSSSTLVYFRAIAIADTGVLWTGHFTQWFRVVTGISIALLHSWTCKMYYFLLFSFGDMAIWFILAVTVDRLIAVAFPLRVKLLCNIKKAYVTVSSLALLAFAKNSHLLFTRGAQYGDDHNQSTITNNCGWPNQDFEYFEKFIRPWIGLVAYAFVPITLIFIFNVVIVVMLLKHNRMKAKKEMTTTSRQPSDAKLSSMTAMFLSVSIVLLVLLIPSISIYVSIPYWAEDPESQATLSLVLAITDTLVHTDHSINFFLYCLTGRKFREEFVSMLCRKKEEAHEGNVSSSVNTTRY